ncbi:MAG TPA: hypothetical protein VEB40_00885 [Flavipsychrobacter sp.]|nr:hypothetical protein [Flavipsychrobacter sp.]
MEPKYKVENPGKLSSWEKIAKIEIQKWLNDPAYQQEVCDTTMGGEMMGPFTKFLYHFACMCECGWGVMVDFNERSQKVFLTDHYYKWMHKLRDQILSAHEAINAGRTVFAKRPDIIAPVTDKPLSPP